MKRIVSLFLCAALAIGAVTYKPPKADAIVLESTGAVALVGLFLTAMGLYWAYDNYQSAVAGAPVTKFGSNLAEELDEYIYEKTGEHRNVIEVMFGGDPDMGPSWNDDFTAMVGTIVTVSAAAVSSISAFGKWLYDKYALSENESAVVASSEASVTFVDGTYPLLSINQTYPLENNNVSVKTSQITNFSGYSWIDVSPGSYSLQMSDAISMLYSLGASEFEVNSSLGDVWKTSSSTFPDSFFLKIGFTVRGNYVVPVIYCSLLGNPYVLRAQRSDYSYPWPTTSDVGLAPASSLSVSAPNGINSPDVDALPEGQGYALEFPDIIADDLTGLLEEAVPEILTNPEYVPILSPTEITVPDPTPDPTPSDEEVPEPAPAGATIIDYLVDIWRKIKALPETIGNGLKSAFEPDPELVTEITTTFTDKFGWLETIHRFGVDLFGMTADSEPPVIYIHLEDAEGKYTYGGTEKALDLSWYQRYKADVDHILSGFMWVAFLWLVFKRASSIIQGGEMVTEYTHDIDQGHR